ncbi:MAG: metallophosphoesterase family protein [bacterium]|jgi:predicted phosphodiesterase
MLTIVFIGPASYKLGGFRFQLALAPGFGQTSLNLPPVGTINARTHLPPLDFLVTLQSVDLDWLQRTLVGGESRELILKRFQDEGRWIIAHFFLRTLILGVLGGAWGACFLCRSWRGFAKGCAIGAAAVVVVASGAVASYRIEAMQSPSYTGVLKGAPWMMGLAQQAWQGLDKLRTDVEHLTQNLRQVMVRANALTPLQGFHEGLKILHVSDLHNNPLGLSFIAQICDSFAPDFIVDTGDLTDFGTPLEEILLRELPGLGVPYYLTLGNHDSPVVAREIDRLPGIQRLEGWAEEKGLSLLGWADPGALNTDIKPATPDAVLAQVTEFSVAIQERGEPPFLLAVHDPRVAEAFRGLVPVIVTGHTHQAKVEERDGSILINAGTTGGAGLRGLQGSEEVPLTAALLYVNNKDRKPCLEAVDLIWLYPREGRFELSRTTMITPLEPVQE